jgi:hypothetical protein
VNLTYTKHPRYLHRCCYHQVQLNLGLASDAPFVTDLEQYVGALKAEVGKYMLTVSLSLCWASRVQPVSALWWGTMAQTICATACLPVAVGQTLSVGQSNVQLLLPHLP